MKRFTTVLFFILILSGYSNAQSVISCYSKTVYQYNGPSTKYVALSEQSENSFLTINNSQKAITHEINGTITSYTILSENVDAGMISFLYEIVSDDGNVVNFHINYKSKEVYIYQKGDFVDTLAFLYKFN